MMRIRPLPLVLALTAILGACSKSERSIAPQEGQASKTATASEPARTQLARAEQKLDDAEAPRQAAKPKVEFALAPSPPTGLAASPVTVTGALAQPASGPADRYGANEPTDTERYAEIVANPVIATREQPVSTFSIDVDTGAYSNVRRFLDQGQLPPTDAVRIEEFINYFDYGYAPPSSAEQPFSVHTELAVAPWNHDRRLLQIGLKGFEVPVSDIPASNLVFLIDVSGSMQSPEKLPLVKAALHKVVKQMRKQDRIAMVVYAGAAGLVLPSTPGSDRDSILAALDALEAGGSTNGAQGIQLAYQVAREHYVEGGVNRVILATDGDFNVGLVDQQDLEDLIERERNSGVALTTLGFGQGNYNDQMAERLADLGNGNHAYIDSEREAEKVLVRELGANLLTIAKDVKIQVEFNPAQVAEYRLIGYENRALAREDFNNDAVDAGEIGAGHTVTALYELTLVGSPATRLPPLRYGSEAADASKASELGFLKLRYKRPDGSRSRLIEHPLAADAEPGAGSDTLRFAAAVAAFGESLRGGKYLDGYSLSAIAQLAAGAHLADPYGMNAEFIGLIERTRSLRGESDQAAIAVAR